MDKRSPWATRLVAERMRRGFTQQQLVHRFRQVASRELPAEHSLLRMVREWESGRRQPGPEYRYLFSRVYGLTEQELFGSPYEVQRAGAVSLLDSDDNAVDTALEGRGLVSTAAQLAFGAELSEPISRIVAQAHEPHMPTRVGIGDVQHIEDTVRLFQTWDHRYGGGLSRDIVLAQLTWACRLLELPCPAQLHGRLNSAVACLADQAAWMTFDVGQQKAARQLFSVSLYAAVAAGNWELRAHVLSDMARQAVHVGHPTDALQLVRLAQSGHDEISPLTQSLLHVVKARAYGHLGETQECLRQIGEAEEQFASDTRDRPQWMSYFTDAQLYGDSGHALFYLAHLHGTKHAEAAHRLALASVSYDHCWARSKALSTVLLATVHFGQSELEQGYAAAERALELANGVRSARIGEHLQGLRESGRRFRHPAIRELNARIATALPNVA